MPSKDVNQYNRSYYQKNREHLLKKQAEKNKRFAENRRKWLVEYKKTLKCVRCEESHPATLTFHHRNNSEKSFEIGNALKLGIGLNGSYPKLKNVKFYVPIVMQRSIWRICLNKPE